MSAENRSSLLVMFFACRSIRSTCDIASLSKSSVFSLRLGGDSVSVDVMEVGSCFRYGFGLWKVLWYGWQVSRLLSFCKVYQRQLSLCIFFKSSNRTMSGRSFWKAKSRVNRVTSQSPISWELSKVDQVRSMRGLIWPSHVTRPLISWARKEVEKPTKLDLIQSKVNEHIYFRKLKIIFPLR